MKKRVLSLLVATAIIITAIPQFAVTVGAVFMYDDKAKDLELGVMEIFETNGQTTLQNQTIYKISITDEHSGTLRLRLTRGSRQSMERIWLYDVDGEYVWATPNTPYYISYEIDELIEVKSGIYYIALPILKGTENRMTVDFTPECTWGDCNIEKAPTCTSGGLGIKECLYCDETDEEVLEKLPHDMKVQSTTRATCEKDGVKTSVCNDCKYTEEDITPKTGFGGKGICIDCGTDSRRLGNVTGSDDVTINDALEILKYLAKLPSNIENNSCNRAAALICDSKATDPTINDALEILKKLAKLPNKIDGTT